MTLILLKNGTFTSDPRLNRIHQFDERSRAFPIRAAVDGKTPISHTWKCTVWLDQKAEGSCTGHALAHELAADPIPVKGMTHQFAVESIYYPAQKADQWPGGEYPGANPVYSGTSVLAATKVVQKLGYIKQYHWAFSLEDLILAVGHQGPAVLGINWYDAMFNADSSGFVHVRGVISGGHAILCKGVNVESKYFVLHNSWGTDWGQGGDCKISFADMDRLLHEGGEAMIPTVRANPKQNFFVNIFNNLLVAFK